jgi:hypothetical protein
VSLAGDIRLNSLSKTARPHDIVDDFGIDDKLPSNPLLFVLEAGMHHKYLDLLLVYAPDGVPAPGKRHPIHSEKGIFHEVKISPTGRLKLGPRRQDIEAHNINPPNCWLEPPTPTPLLSPHTQIVEDRAREIEEAQNNDDSRENPLPRIDTPIVSDTLSPTTSTPNDDTVI